MKRLWIAIVAFNLVAINLAMFGADLGTQATFRTENLDVTNQADVANALIAHSGVTLTSNVGPTIKTITSDPSGAVVEPRGSLRTRTDTAAVYLNTNGGTTWVSLLSNLQAGNVLAGPGIDGSAHFDGAATVLGLVPVANVYTLIAPIDVTDLIIDGGVTINPDGYPIHFSGTWSGSGTISAKGNDANVRIGGTARTGHILPGSTAGGNGGIGVATAATVGGATATVANDCVVNTAAGGSTGLACGGGGGGCTAADGCPSNAGRAGGAVTKSNAQNALQFRTIGWMIGNPGSNVVYSGSSGGGGGGASNNSSVLGGGGGAGGGWVQVFGKTCSSTATVTVAGGAGGNGTCDGVNAAGGGGGGGAGIAIVVCGNGTLPTIVTSGGPAGSSCLGGTSAGDGGPGVNFSWVVN